MIEIVDVVTRRYYDSVRLMQVSRSIADMNGVQASMVAMGTDLNLGLLSDMGFDSGHTTGAGADDLLIAVRADDQATADLARAEVDRLLTAASRPAAGAPFTPPPPHTVESAADSVGANLALISVPGPHAFVEAMAALEHGMHVMVFSDNVSVEHELALKTKAATEDLLVMGPDCGTAIVHGLGLGFSNVVEPGPVAITGASGTGIQQLCCLFDASGVGVRHALGTGTRDLSAEIGARSTLAALDALDADPEVGVIVLVSKPPDPSMAKAVGDAVSACRTPVVNAMLGSADVTLEAAARQAVEVLGKPWVEPPTWRTEIATSRSGALRGLFSGGTLRAEAKAIAEEGLGQLADEPGVSGHWLCDFGDDRYTRGRAHPMIDPAIRLDALAATIDDSETGVVVVDVVLGLAAHPDPASGLVPLVEDARNSGVAVIVSLCGSRGDPQGRDDQARRLMEAGAEVYQSNAAAAGRAVQLTEGVGGG